MHKRFDANSSAIPSLTPGRPGRTTALISRPLAPGRLLAHLLIILSIIVALFSFQHMGDGAPPAFAQDQTCVAPTVTVGQIFAYRVTVNLEIPNADLDPNKYQVRFKTQSETAYPERWQSFPASDNLPREETIRNFEGATAYDLQFRVDCDDDIFSSIVTRQVTTKTPFCVQPTAKLLTTGEVSVVFEMTAPSEGRDANVFEELEVTSFEERHKLVSGDTWTEWAWIASPLHNTRLLDNLIEEEDHDIQLRSECHDSGNIIYSSTIETRASTFAFARSFSLKMEVDGREINDIDEGQTATVTLTIVGVQGGIRLAYKRNHQFQLQVIPYSDDPSIQDSGDPSIQVGEILVSNAGPTADNPNPSPTGGFATLFAGQESVTWTLTAPADSVAYDDDDADDEFGSEKFTLTVPKDRETRNSTTRSGILTLNDSKAAAEREIAGRGHLQIYHPPLIPGTIIRSRTLGIKDPDGLMSPPGFTYQWLGDSSPILGETGSDYKVTLSDINTEISLTVSFTDAEGNAETRTSEASFIPSGPVITWPGKPTPPSPGQTLTANTGAITYRDLSATPNYMYEWYYTSSDGFTVISGTLGTSSTLTLTNDDHGKHISVVVAYSRTNSARFTVWANAPTPAVGGTLLSVVSDRATGTVAISGTQTVASTLIGTVSNVMDDDGITNVSYTYQWLRNGQPISGATSNTYVITPADVNTRLSLRVYFRDDENNVEILTSAQTGLIPARVDNAATGDVTVTGTAELRQTLTGAVANVMDDDGITNVSYAYQWLRNGQSISGATAQTYVVQAADVGAKLRLRVSFNDDIGFATTLLSDETATVPSGPVIRYPSGAYSDETISVDTSTITYADVPSPSSYTYQWIHVDANGAKEVDGDISGATSGSYTLTQADDQKYIQVEVSYISTVTNSPVTRLANNRTPQISERPPLEIPMGLTATVPSLGGSVTVSWSLSSLGGDAPTGFQYRYKPTVLTGFDNDYSQDWQTASRGASVRSITITGSLINVAEYTFEVRSFSSTIPGSDETTASATVVYRHRVVNC